MAEILTYDEITKRYPDEWILVNEPRKDPGTGVYSGEVVFHSPDRDVMYGKMLELKLRHIGSLYTGNPNADDDHIFAL